MTTQVQDVHEDVHPRRQQLSLGSAVAITLRGLFLLVKNRASVPRLFRDGFKAPYAELKS